MQVRDPHPPHTEAMGTWMRPKTGTLQVYLDDMDAALLALPIDLGHAVGSDDGRAWVGVTAATGRRYQEHHVLSWQFCEGPGGCARPMGYCEAFGCNPEYPSPSFGASGSGGRYADLERGVPHLSHPEPVPAEGTDYTTRGYAGWSQTGGTGQQPYYEQANAGAEYGDELDGDDASMAAAAAAEGNPARLPIFGADVVEEKGKDALQPAAVVVEKDTFDAKEVTTMDPSMFSTYDRRAS